MKNSDNSIVSLSDCIDVRCMRQLDTHHQLLGSIKNAAKDQRIKVFFSSTKTPIGYVVWARLNKEALIMMSKTIKMPPYPHEWSEGKFMVVFDVVFSPQWENIAMSKLIRFLGRQRFFAFIRRGRFRAYMKIDGQHRRYQLKQE